MFERFKKIFVTKESQEPQIDEKKLIEKVEAEEKTVVDLINEFGSDLDLLKAKVKSLEKKLQQNNAIVKKLIEVVQEENEFQIASNVDDSRLQLIEHKERELRKKYDAILNILAEKFAENEVFPNLFVGDVSLRELWRKYPNHKDVLLYSIAYMMKKEFEEKGVKIR
jgi:hypothetical protein